MSANPTYIPQMILISDILLDVHNVRTGEQSSQSAALAAMIKVQEQKLVKLAEDIVAWGLNPTDIVSVYPEGNKYIVPEGNRRVTALKLLNNPTLADGTSIEKHIKALAQNAKNIPTQIPCIVFKTREEMQHWMDIKHMGEQGGAGTIRWNSVQKSRAAGKTDRGLELIDLVITEGSLTEDEIEEVLAVSFPITNLNRILNTPQVLDTFGLIWEGQGYSFKGDKAKSLAAATQVIREVKDRLSVSVIKNQKQRIEYAAGTLKKLGIEGSISPNTNNGTESKQSSPTKKSGPQRTLKKSNARSTLVPSSCAIHIRTPARVNELFKELKELKLSDSRNVIAVGFRVFLELSTDEYLKKNNVVFTNQNKPINVTCSSCGQQNSINKTGGPKFSPTLLQKLKATIDHMEQAAVLTKGEAKAVRKEVTDPNSLVFPANLHDYAHNPNSIPKEKELKDMWDILQYFLQKIWT